MMEASGAGVGDGGTQTATGGADAGGDGGQQQGQPDLQSVMDRMGALDDLAEQVQGVHDFLETGGYQQGSQQGGQQQEGGEPELFLDQSTGQIVDGQGNQVDLSQFTEGGQQQQEGQIPQQALQALANTMSAQMQQQLAPILEQFQDQKAEDLMGRYPALKDDAYADKIVTAAEELAATLQAPQLARDARVVELLHLAEIGRGRAAGDGADGAGASETEVQLETGGVSSPGGGQETIESRLDKAIAARTQANRVFD